MARTLKAKKISSMQQMSHVRRQTDTLLKYYKEMLEINHTVTKMSTALDKLIGQLEMV